MTYEEARDLIAEHLDYGGSLDSHALAVAISSPDAALESRVLAEGKPVAWAVPQEMAGASFIACCVQGGAYTVPLFTHPTPDDAKDTERLNLIIEQDGLRIKKSSDGYVVWDCSNGLEIAGEGNTAREALDAAIDRARQSGEEGE
jgi:hypothetical protein